MVLGQIHHAGLQAEVVAGLVEGDVTLWPMLSNWRSMPPSSAMRSFIMQAHHSALQGPGQAVEHEGVLRMDVNMVEEIVLQK